MVRQTGSARPAEFPAGWARWLALGVFAALIAVGLLPLRPNPAAAIAAAAVAIAAAALLLAQRRPLLVYAVAATAGVAVLGYGMSSNLVWFVVCLIAASSRDATRRWFTGPGY
jgi:hypothetical protein